MAAATALLLSLFGFDGSVGDKINSHLEESARAEAIATITECRDKVKCYLTDISLRNNNQVEDWARRVDYKIIDTIKLGEYECKVGKTESGFIIAIGDTVYLVGKTEQELNNNLNEIKEKLNQISDSRNGMKEAFALSH